MKIKDRIAKLIDVKTIVTFSILGLFVYLGIIQAISPDKVWDAFLMIIGFYFGTQHEKVNAHKISKEDESNV